MPTTPTKTATKTYTITTAEPHSYGFSSEVDDLREALDLGWQLYKMTECMAVVIDNDPEGTGIGTEPAVRLYEVGAKYIGEDA